MKIKYAFLDGTVTEVEVSDEIGAVIIDSRKAERAQDERHRYHCYSYDAIDYEGEEYGACDEYAVEDDSAEQTARIREAFSHLIRHRSGSECWRSRLPTARNRLVQFFRV